MRVRESKWERGLWKHREAEREGDKEGGVREEARERREGRGEIKERGR